MAVTNGSKRRLSAVVKARIAMEAIRGEKTAAQISSEHGCHASQVAKVKKTALDGLPSLYGLSRREGPDEKTVASLYEQIGRLKMEVEWLKKKLV